jgi:hypothetical protein
MIMVRRISKDFGDTHALDAVDLHVDQGRVVALLGPKRSAAERHGLGGALFRCRCACIAGARDSCSAVRWRRARSARAERL